MTGSGFRTPAVAAGVTGDDLPVVTPPFPGGDAGAGTGPASGDGAALRVGGVLLAAGASSRFGDRNKLLASAAGEPVVRRAARALVDAPPAPVVVVLGHEADRVRRALDGLPVAFAENDRYRAGQASSLATGVCALRDRAPGVDAVVVGLGDMPSVTAGTVETLVAAYRAGAGDALAAAHDGTRGNPVLFDARFLDALADVTGDVGGREVLLGAEDAALVDVDDPGVRRDVDEPGDLP